MERIVLERGEGKYKVLVENDNGDVVRGKFTWKEDNGDTITVNFPEAFVMGELAAPYLSPAYSSITTELVRLFCAEDQEAQKTAFIGLTQLFRNQCEQLKKDKEPGVIKLVRTLAPDGYQIEGTPKFNTGTLYFMDDRQEIYKEEVSIVDFEYKKF